VGRVGGESTDEFVIGYGRFGFGGVLPYGGHVKYIEILDIRWTCGFPRVVDSRVVEGDGGVVYLESKVVICFEVFYSMSFDGGNGFSMVH